ncbi:hypothetical protein HGRIS_002690 [Hohenbuehelia grisea]|uniref:Cdc23 domain-containing protein n=1 Tax=Hohenbuehelia grisea TaxID=104357 RepID=A0ABR3JL88_9AGAR
MAEPVIVDVQMVAAIRAAVKECTDRRLSAAAKWTSELLLSIPPEKRRQSEVLLPSSTFATSTPARPGLSHAFAVEHSPISTQIATQPDSQASSSSSPLFIPSRHPHAAQLKLQSEEALAAEWALEALEHDDIVAAQGCFDQREYQRVNYLLKDCKSSKALFLSVYSRFLATEKKALRDWHKLDSNRHQPPLPINTALSELLELVKNSEDPWLIFLKSLFLSRLSRREEAIESALLSIAGFPWNWSAWTLLGTCIGDGDELSAILPLMPLLPTHPLVQFFQVKTMNELHSPSENELGLCDRLLSEQYFPNSLWIMSLRACVLYLCHDFRQAIIQFEQILEQNPYRVDQVDTFSNILYVTNDHVRLSRLAEDFLALDKDKPEVCCLVGNHYSLRAEHEKAVKYFRRATQLDRTHTSAWTLMGHEYVEMKNSHAAIEAYRRAVDVNRKDYRAWYGLGQAYELLSMHQYALYYYQHATALRPYDVRLWQAQGMCYEELGRLRESIECLKRALIGADPHETTINLKLAKLHCSLGELEESAAYHRRIVEVCQADQKPITEYAKSCLEVAEYQLLRNDGDLMLAQQYAEIVAGSNAEEVGLASEVLKKIRARLHSKVLGFAPTSASAKLSSVLPPGGANDSIERMEE